jgi:hypothetical protein
LSSDVNECVEKVIKELNYFNELINIWKSAGGGLSP